MCLCCSKWSQGQRSQIDLQWSALSKHICIVTEPLSKPTKEQETFPSQKQEVSHATCSNLWEFPAGQVTNLQYVHSAKEFFFSPKFLPKLCNRILFGSYSCYMHNCVFVNSLWKTKLMPLLFTCVI